MPQFNQLKRIAGLLLFGLILLVCPACQDTPKPTQVSEKRTETAEKPSAEALATDPATRDMVQQLRELAKVADPQSNYHMNHRRLEMIKSDYNRLTDIEQKKNLTGRLVSEYLNAGDAAGCLKFLDEIKTLHQIPDSITDESKGYYLFKALAYLRLGERANCVENHTPDNCILPLKATAVHKNREGSENAAQIYEQLCQFDPTDDQSRWLLNFAYITLGEYPNGVPKEFLIKGLDRKQPGTNVAKFKDIAGKLMINVHALSGGACVEDFDNDGDLDIVASSWGYEDQIRFYRQADNGFISSTKSSGLTGLTGGLNMIHADYNNDGFEDVLVLRGAWLQEAGKHPNSLLKNNGDGTFSDVTRSTGLSSRYPTQNAAWADIDLDGDLDLFVGHEGYRSHLYINDGQGKFRESGKKRGIDFRKFVKGSTFTDVNNDGWPDLFVSVLGKENLLLINKEGQFSLSENPDQQLAEPKMSFPCWSWDVNNDGWEDIFVACYDMGFESLAGGEYSKWLQGKPVKSARSALYINRGDGTFLESAEEFGLTAPLFAMGSNFGDYNNDGFLDCYIGTGTPNLASVLPNFFFQNASGKRFDDVTLATGTAHIQKGHAVSFADIDRDGDLDIYTVLGGAFEGDAFQNALFQNQLGASQDDNEFLFVKLVGTESNRSAIGARVELICESPDGVKRSIHRTVGTGGSFGSSPLLIHFGLKKVSKLVKLIIKWPNKNQTVQTFEDLANVRNRLIKVTESVAAFDLLDYDEVDFSK